MLRTTILIRRWYSGCDVVILPAANYLHLQICPSKKVNPADACYVSVFFFFFFFYLCPLFNTFNNIFFCLELLVEPTWILKWSDGEMSFIRNANINRLNLCTITRVNITRGVPTKFRQLKKVVSWSNSPQIIIQKMYMFFYLEKLK